MNLCCCAGTRGIGSLTSWMLSVTTLCAIAIGQLHLASSAQTPQLHPRTREQREQAFRAEHHAILNVKVTDQSGNPIIGLASNDFTVLDNSQPRALGPFQFVEHGTRIASPRVVLVLDVLNQSTREFAEDTSGVRKFLTGKSGNWVHQRRLPCCQLPV